MNKHFFINLQLFFYMQDQLTGTRLKFKTN